MSCYRIEYRDGKKIMLPVGSKAEYLQLRGSRRQKELLKAVRGGDDDAKRKLLQFNYSCIPGEDGMLKGCTQMSDTIGMDIDHIQPKLMAETAQHILDMKDELELLMLEKSARGQGYHLVMKRKTHMSQEENLQWASKKLGVEYDKGAKDITRVFFATTEEQQELLFVDDKLFTASPPALPRREGAANASKTPQAAPFLPYGHPFPQGGKESDSNDAERDLSTEGMSSEGTAAADVTNPLPPRGKGCPEGGKGAVGGKGALPYSRIIPTFFKMECAGYPAVHEGIRNATIFSVVAKYLRYCTDHSFDLIKRLIYPEYSFGLSEGEVDGIIRSALAREVSLTPRAVKQVVSKFGHAELNEADGDGDGTIDDSSPYRPLSEYIIDEAMMPPLPRWVNVLLKVAPPGYKFLTLACCEPAMMTLLTDVNCKFGSKKVTRLNGWTHLDGPPATNKSVCLQPIPTLLHPIIMEDDRNQMREDEYFDKVEESEFEKTKKPKKPQNIVIRVLPPNTTRIQHIKRMHDAKGKHTYTYAEEIQSLELGTGGTYHNRKDFMQLLFDNGWTGNQSMNSKSIRCRVQVAWNLTTSGTRDQTIRTFNNATNGAVTRVFFLLIPDNRRDPKPVYLQYNDEEEKLIHRAAEIMSKMNGLVLTPKLDKALDEWTEKIRLESQEDSERLCFKNRAADIAHKFGVTMHLAWIAQKIMDTEDAEQRRIVVEDLDLGQYAERRACIDMALYAADQCLDGQYRLWAKKMKQQLESAYEGCAVFKKSDQHFTEIPKEFTYSSLAFLFPNMKPAALRKMVERWKKAGHVKDADRLQDGEKVFLKSS